MELHIDQRSPWFNVPLSPGYRVLSHGIVGSMNGEGVLMSRKMGMLIATLAPRRDRMLPVKVLDRETDQPIKNQYLSLPVMKPKYLALTNSRKPRMRIGHTLTDEQTLARVAIRFTPRFWHSERRIRHSQPRVACDRDRELIGFEMTLCQLASESHVLFDRDEVTKRTRVRCSWSRFEHVSAILRMKGWHDHAV
jgi:hypothetical protein